ncbi:MAG: Diaminopimelate decarboxylase [Promethearchaeota archaeon]|nr:MAG: Diaminopimelate decarboxylase [Candidatus Lokiarchaeota archaeon]
MGLIKIMEYDKWLKEKSLDYKDGVLYHAGINTIDLAKKYGTPLYVVNEELIRKRYQHLKTFLSSHYEQNEIHYAVKANSHLAVLKILKSEGASVDCSSVGEVYACLKAGFTPDKIIYTGNMFTDDDFRFAVKNDILVNLDSISQLPRLAKIYAELDKQKDTISFRINPEFGAGHHSHTITAGKDIKFGILDNQVIEAYSKAKNLGFKSFGTHIHIGSGILDPIDYDKAINKYFTIIMKLADRLDLKFDFIDYGGGLGIPYKQTQDPIDIERYLDIILNPFLKLMNKEDFGSPTVKIEPGRYLVGESTIILTQINTIKDNGYKKFAGVDAGFHTLVRPTMYGSYHHIISCRNPNQKKEQYSIAGPICESGDILGEARMLPPLREEDYLAILDAGAYGFTMTSVYNSRPRPAEILLNDGKSYLIREKETLEDLFRLQKIPKHLK